MSRRPSHKTLQIALGLIVALGIAATRSEKIFSELAAAIPHTAAIAAAGDGQTPFDPARVPQSGGMASRLLAGIVVKPV